MEKQKFDELVERLQGYAARDPRGYEGRVLLLGILGYVYLAAVFLLLMGLLGLALFLLLAKQKAGGLSIQILIFTVGLIYLVVRSFWITLPPPWGYRLKREEAPRLFAMVDEVCRRLKSPPAHEIVVDGQFNASITQVPRLGIFGWYRNYLCLGLPLMMGMGPDQFRAVVAHEFGHLAGSHGKTGAWIYRIRESWMRLFDSLQSEQHAGSFLFIPFFKWYLPFFNAYSFVLARKHEYEADRAAGEIAGKEAITSSLAVLSVQGPFVDKSFWPSVYAKVNSHQEPPDTVFSDLSVQMRAGVPHDKERMWLRDAFHMQTHNGDTHPSLRDRLSALGHEIPDEEKLLPLITSRPPLCAGEELMGAESWAKVIKEFDLKWREDMKVDWAQRNEYVRAKFKEIDELEEGSKAGTLSPPLYWKRAQLVYDVKGPDAAVGPLKDVVRVNPRHAEAHLRLGHWLLEADDREGVVFLEKAYELNPFYTFEACQHLMEYFERKGEYDRAKVYDRRMTEMDPVIAKAMEERVIVNGMKLIPHGWDAERLEYLVRQLEPFRNDIAEAYFVRKELKYLPEQPFYILIVKAYAPWYKLRSHKDNQRLVDRLAEAVDFNLDCGTPFLLVEYPEFLKAARKVSGVPVFTRKK